MSKQRGLKTAPPAGTKVRLTGYFLKATGQVRGVEGSKRWTALGRGECGFGPKCLCSNGEFVAVNEAIDPAGYEDVVSTRADGRLMRHIATSNLEIVGAAPKAEDQSDDVGPVAVFGGGK